MLFPTNTLTFLILPIYPQHQDRGYLFQATFKIRYMENIKKAGLKKDPDPILFLFRQTLWQLPRFMTLKLSALSWWSHIHNHHQPKDQSEDKMLIQRPKGPQPWPKYPWLSSLVGCQWPPNFVGMCFSLADGKLNYPFSCKYRGKRGHLEVQTRRAGRWEGIWVHPSTDVALCLLAAICSNRHLKKRARSITEKCYYALPLIHCLGGKQGFIMKSHFTDGETQGKVLTRLLARIQVP